MVECILETTGNLGFWKRGKPDGKHESVLVVIVKMIAETVAHATPVLVTNQRNFFQIVATLFIAGKPFQRPLIFRK